MKISKFMHPLAAVVIGVSLSGISQAAQNIQQQSQQRIETQQQVGPVIEQGAKLQSLKYQKQGQQKKLYQYQHQHKYLKQAKQLPANGMRQGVRPGGGTGNMNGKGR